METEPTRMCALLVGLPDVIVVGVGEWPSWLRIVITTTATLLGSPSCCGVVAHRHGVREVELVAVLQVGDDAVQVLQRHLPYDHAVLVLVHDLADTAQAVVDRLPVLVVRARRSGLVADVAGVRTAIVSGGILCVAGVIGTSVWLREFWRYDSRTDEHAVRERDLRSGVPASG